MNMNRTEGIGGSDVAAVCGLDPNKTPYQLWREKTGVDPSFPGNAATRRGNFLESVILETYRRQQEPALFRTGVEVVDGWRSAHVDALAEHATSPLRVVEAKSVSQHAFRRDWGEPWTDEVPDRALCQGLWYAGLTGASVIDFPVAVIPDDPDEVMGLSAAEVMERSKFHVFRVIPTGEMIQRLTNRAYRFWHDHVLPKVEPEPVNIGDVHLRWPTHAAGKTKPATPEVLELLKRLQNLGEAERQAKDERDTVREALMIYAEDSEALVLPDGRPLATIKTQDRKGYTVEAASFRAIRLRSGSN